MQNIHYPLIISDFDGTLVKKDGTIGERNKKAIASFLAAGGKFALSTGRLPYGIVHHAKALGLKGMISCCQGSIIMDIESGSFVSEGQVPHASVIAACKKMEEMDLHFHAYTADRFYSNKDDEALREYEKIVQGNAVRVVDTPLSVFLEERQEPIYKLLTIVPEEKSDEILQTLQASGLEGCAFTKSANFFVEIIPKGYSKGTAVEFLANYYGIPIEKTVGIGDQRNDIPMIQKAGIGVAVQNGDTQLKAVADYVCERTHEEDAIAEVIERFGLVEDNV